MECYYKFILSLSLCRGNLECATHPQPGLEVSSVTWIVVTGHTKYYGHDYKEIKLNPTPQLLLVLQLPAKGRKNYRPPACLQAQYRTSFSVKSMILLRRPKPTLTFLKQCLDQTIPGKSLHNASTTGLNHNSFLWAFIHRPPCSDSQLESVLPVSDRSPPPSLYT